MPPRIRTRASKALKENIDSDKVKSARSNTKASRKPLADKTNSASDDTSVEIPKKIKADVRPHRDRRLPTRFKENPVLVNLSNKSKDNNDVTPKSKSENSSKPISTSTINNTSSKSSESKASLFKTPSKTETSLVVSRPRRICRLPSRFDDHSISPSKYIPIQPANASTPKQSNVKPTSNKENSKEIKNLSEKQTSTVQATRSTKTAAPQIKVKDNILTEKISPDTNNNAKARSARAKKAQPKVVPPKKVSPNLIISNTSIRKFFNRTNSPELSPTKKITPKASNGQKINVNNLSFKVLGGQKSLKDNNKDDLDIYEFTFNPEEEPQPQKKKRKKPATKKAAKVTKPKIIYKSTYDQNISKALSALKQVVKTSQSVEPAKLPQILETSNQLPAIAEENNVVTSNTSSMNKENNVVMNDTGKTSVHECNYASIRVEDIAADIEPNLDQCDDINYSPVNSPRLESSVGANSELDPKQTPGRPIPSNDPLNLQEELSFFDDVPVASSSMNTSIRHPLASPWRVEFGSLPIKWHSNTYVKPNMTPAVESSFICSEESNKKKHVYTNMVPEENESLPQIVSDTPSLKQTSIISFIKEVAERQAKKKRGRSVSLSKAVAVFDNVDSNTHHKNATEKPISNELPTTDNNTSEEVSTSNKDSSNDKENSKEERKTRKHKNNENICDRPAKSPRKQKDKNSTYFGFDDSEDLDQENLSPTKVKDNGRGRSLRPRSRAVLQEINGPTRAALPFAAKTKTATSSEAINRVYEELKSTADAPVFPEKNVEANVTSLSDPSINEDSESLHLFEDIELMHHLKPTRKSYGKAKKVTFCQRATSESDSEEGEAILRDTSFEDDLGDLTFELRKFNAMEKKKSKKKPKKLMSKKEEKEADAWAAGFNSMCEEVEKFPLVLD